MNLPGTGLALSSRVSLEGKTHDENLPLTARWAPLWDDGFGDLADERQIQIRAIPDFAALHLAADPAVVVGHPIGGVQQKYREAAGHSHF